MVKELDKDLVTTGEFDLFSSVSVPVREINISGRSME